MRHSYAGEKFGVAVYALATGTGTLQDRIWEAYLSFHTLNREDFSDDLKDYWDKIDYTLTREEPSYDENGQITTGKVQNTLAKMSTQEAAEIAELICELDAKLRYDD